DRSSAARDRALELFTTRRGLAVGREVCDVTSDDALARRLEDFLPPLVGLADDAVGRQDRDRVVGIVEEQPIPLLGGRESGEGSTEGERLPQLHRNGSRRTSESFTFRLGEIAPTRREHQDAERFVARDDGNE